MRTQATVDRIQTLAIMVSAVTGQTFRFYGITNLTVGKDDSGNAGTWQFETSDIEPTVRYGPSDDAAAYIQVSSPMDLCAIYARRLATTASGGVERLADPIGPDPYTTLQYGGDSGATVRALGRPLAPITDYDGPGTSVSDASCLMVGMVDGAFERVDAQGRTVGFRATGKDLTKIPYVNFTTVPQTAQNSQAMPTLAYIALARDTSGYQLLLDALDLTVAKVFPKSAIGPNGLSASDATTFSAWGYPWRDFLSTGRLTDAAFRSFKSVDGQRIYPPFKLQGGSAWANILELSNPPINRLFVDEWGQLVFDDAFNAWTAGSIYDVEPSEVQWFEAGFSDDTLITFLSTSPAGSLAGYSNIVRNLGIARNNGFVGGLGEAKSADAAHVKRYGYRYAAVTSLFDVDYNESATRRKAIIFANNNLWRAQAIVRGRPFFRVGDRYRVKVETNRPETTNQPWYCHSVRHDIAQDQDWTVTLDLAYPPPVG